MVVMAGAVFLAVRLLLAAVPALALRYPTKKWAAAVASLAAFGYLLLSGSQVATVRSFLMISIMFLAVMVDRPALAMRNVALAALSILAIEPECLLDVGFQMSFAAVVSLLSVYEAVRDGRGGQDRSGALQKLAFFFGGIVLSTLVASLAVAPFAAYHFHRSQQFAVLANLLAIPICNVIVMPAGLMTLVLMPLGWEALPLSVMGWGIDAMVWTANEVAGLPGAVVHIAAIPEPAFGLMVAGGLWLTLWRTRWRLLGVAAIAAGLGLAPTRERPDILVGRDGTLVAIRDVGGTLEALSARGAAFELARWLEQDGDARTPLEAAAANGFTCDGSGCTASVHGVLVSVARHPSAFADDCARAQVLIASVPAPSACDGPRVIVDYPALRREGTHALYVKGAGEIRIETVAATRGQRPWSARPAPVARKPAPLRRAGKRPATCRACEERAHRPRAIWTTQSIRFRASVDRP
jgi:competence protein ComEC